MQKPEITRKLTKIAAIVSIVGICLQIMLTVFRAPLTPLYGELAREPIPPLLIVVQIVTILLNLPLTVLAYLHTNKGELTHHSAFMTVLLAPVFYFGKALLMIPVRFFLSNLILHLYSTSVLAAYNVASSAQSVFGFCQLFAFVLICCAGAIELFITTYPPSDGVHKEETK